MSTTYQNIVDLARIPLNDEDKARYSDDTLLAYTNTAMLALFHRRPDIFIGQYDNLPSIDAALTDTFPLPDSYRSLMADYVTSRTAMIDDEHANSGLAGAFMQLLGSEIQ
jgi:hypothetical protein